MIEFSDYVKQKALDETFKANQSRTWFLTLYSGTIPDLDAVQSEVYLTNSPSAANWNSKFEFNNPDIKGLCYRSMAGITASWLSPTKVRIPLSSYPHPMTYWREGTIGWFVLGQSSAGSPTVTNYTYESVMIVGTVGLTGSGADMELPDLNVVSTSEIYANDIILNLA